MHAGLCTITASEDFMRLGLESRFVRRVYVMECVGRIVPGAEVMALKREFEAEAREFARCGGARGTRRVC